MTEKPDLTALLGSRLCHDLISPIGAIGNGVELLMLDTGGHRPELALISESVAHANARIRFFRLAFGAAGTAEQMVARSECAGILGDLTRGGRMSIAWQSPTSLPRREAKLAFLIVMCLESALPHGGKIAIERGEARWTLRGTGPRLKIDGDLWEMLSNPAARPDITAGNVHFALLRDELARQHRRLTVEVREEEIRLSF